MNLVGMFRTITEVTESVIGEGRADGELGVSVVVFRGESGIANNLCDKP